MEQSQEEREYLAGAAGPPRSVGTSVHTQFRSSLLFAPLTLVSVLACKNSKAPGEADPHLVLTAVSGNTQEDGHQAIFSVALSTKPTATVGIELSSTAPEEGTVDHRRLTFSTDNWAAPQVVTVTGQDDALADGDAWYEIVLGAPRTSDSDYADLPESYVEILNVDDDSPGIVVGPLSRNTDESGAQATFTVVLTSEPEDEVLLGIVSGNSEEGTTDKDLLVFDPVNWRSPQMVTVTGQDDSRDDGDTDYAILFAAAASADPGYATLLPAPIDLSNVDNDVAGLRLSPVSGNTQESGAAAKFDVALGSEPISPVQVQVTSTDPTEGLPTAGQLTFTPSNWQSPQTVTIQGQDDGLSDGSQPYAITLSTTLNSDAGYASLLPRQVDLFNVDNDSAGVTISQVSGDTSEAGGQATFTVVLNSEPTGDVSWLAFSSDAGEGELDQNTLTFTPSTWRLAQRLTVTGRDDLLSDGNAPYRIQFSPVSSVDPNYAALRLGDVELINVDNDSAGVTVGNVSGATSENGGQASIGVVLNTEPEANVTLNFATSDPGEGTVANTSLTFTALSWSVPQTITITGVDDRIADGNAPYTLQFAPIASLDSDYAAITPRTVSLSNLDDDSAGVTVGSVVASSTVSGSPAVVTVVLDTEPVEPVTVHFDGSGQAEALTNVPSLTFSPANWNTPQTATAISAGPPGGNTFGVRFLATTSQDPSYAGLVPRTVLVASPATAPPTTPTPAPTPTQPAGITVSALSGPVTESGTTATFTAVLAAQPSAPVTVPLRSNTPTESALSQPSLIFTAANWNIPQTITVRGVDDLVADGDSVHQVVFSPALSADPAYSLMIAPPLLVQTLDDDPSLVLNTSSTNFTLVELGGRASFLVSLDTAPQSAVQVSVASSDTAQGVVLPAALVFSTTNWNVPQLVSVAAVDNATSGANPSYDIVVGSTVTSNSGTVRHTGVLPQSVTFRNADGLD